ncbi:MAG: hypothetical protein Q9160_008455 [Pyrenula sp. 1 TL-2023]
MTNVDIDDSLSDQEEYTETNVLLGYASKEPIDDTTSHLGGHPSFLSEKHPPLASFSTCKVCSSYLSLLLQLNGDLPERFPDNERRLYLFACRKKQCRRKAGSIRGYREVRKWRNPQSTTANKSIMQEPIRPPPASSAVENATEPSWRCGTMTPDQFSQGRGGDMGGLVFNSSGPFGKPLSDADNRNPFSIGATANSNPSSNPFAPPETNPFSPSEVKPLPNGQAKPEPQANTPSNPLPPPSTLAAKPPQPPSTPTSQPNSTSNTTQTHDPSPLSETFASKLRVSSPPTSTTTPTPSTPWPPLTSFPPPYPLYHLDADYETLDPEPAAPLPSSSSASTSKSAYDDPSDPPSKSSTTTTDDASTLTDSAHDPTFLRFSTRLSQNPSQVLRYEFGGHPLLYSSTDAVASRFPSSSASSSSSKIPSCENCGGKRVFELQLVPGAISALEDEEQEQEQDAGIDGDEGMEWGTVILGVCERDCGAGAFVEGTGGEVGWREEWVGVQWEERVVRK